MQSVYNNVAPIPEWSRESNELRRGGEYRVINSLLFEARDAWITDIYVNLYFYEYGLKRWH